MKKGFFLLAFVSIICLVLVGCGNTDTTVNKKEAVKLMDQIKKNKKLVVGTEAALAPFEFVQDGKIVGYGPDILHEIVKDMGVELEQLDVPFSGILTGLEAKQYDVIATALTTTPERKEKFGLTTPIAYFSQILVKAKNNSEINSLDDIDGKTIGCVAGSTGLAEIEEYNKKAKADGLKGFVINVYASNPESFLELKNNRIDLIFLDETPVRVLMEENPDVYEILGEFGVKSYITWAVRKEDTDLLEFLNTEILKMKKSGKLAELQEKWFSTTWDLPDNI